MSDDDFFSFADEASHHLQPLSTPPSYHHWHILIVDDDADVHLTTQIAMSGLVVEGRDVMFHSCYSAYEAYEFLSTTELEICVILLDVVMESPDAGLKLVGKIRQDLQMNFVRIILRTGQPGYAPEVQTIQQLDINDYKSKSELTRSGLFTSLSVAIRSYSQLINIEISRKGLIKIVHAINDLSCIRGLAAYTEGAVLQICSLLSVPEDGIVCVQSEEAEGTDGIIIAAAGQYAELINQPLSSLPSSNMKTNLEGSLRTKKNVISDTAVLFFKVADGTNIATGVETKRRLTEVDESLLKAFCASVSVGLDNVNLNQKIEALAFTDPLLNIPNRNSFEQAIEKQLASNKDAILMLIDIDDFASINAVLDQNYGDEVLKAVCQKIISSINSNVVISRVSGDCFGLVGAKDDVCVVRISRVFNEAFQIGGQEIRLSVTSGVVDLHSEGVAVSGRELLKDASIALKQAKIFNRGKVKYFASNLRQDAKSRIELLNGLRSAFSSERLFLHYQPQLDLNSRKVIGAEALLRWKNNDGQFIPPDKFIPLAEQSGMIIPIGAWVLRQSIAQLRRLIDMGFEKFRMSINVSYVQFRDPGFLKILVDNINYYSVPAEQIEIELTESIAIDSLAFINTKINQIRALGVTVAMDDFGTGYSSLSILNRLTFDRLKIDRSFIKNIDGSSSDNNIVRVIVNLAKSFGVKVVAEGVESSEQETYLKQLGCDEVQGYLYAKPMDVLQLNQWLIDA